MLENFDYMNWVNKTNWQNIYLRVQPYKRSLRLNTMTFCPEHPKWDQNPKFTPLSETTNIRAASPAPRVTCLHLSTISVISVKRLVVEMLPTMKQQRLQSRLQHSWLNNCVTTEMWWPVYGEHEGLFCLLCKKHDTSNPQNKSNVLNKESCKPLRPEQFEDNCRTSQHMNAVSAMLKRASVFQRTLDERERVAEDVRIGSWKKSYLTTRSSHL